MNFNISAINLGGSCCFKHYKVCGEGPERDLIYSAWLIRYVLNGFRGYLSPAVCCRPSKCGWTPGTVRSGWNPTGSWSTAPPPASAPSYTCLHPSPPTCSNPHRTPTAAVSRWQPSPRRPHLSDGPLQKYGADPSTFLQKCKLGEMMQEGQVGPSRSQRPGWDAPERHEERESIITNYS